MRSFIPSHRRQRVDPTFGTHRFRPSIHQFQRIRRRFLLEISMVTEKGERIAEHLLRPSVGRSILEGSPNDLDWAFIMVSAGQAPATQRAISARRTAWQKLNLEAVGFTLAQQWQWCAFGVGHAWNRSIVSQRERSPALPRHRQEVETLAPAANEDSSRRQ